MMNSEQLSSWVSWARTKASAAQSTLLETAAKIEDMIPDPATDAQAREDEQAEEVQAVVPWDGGSQALREQVLALSADREGLLSSVSAAPEPVGVAWCVAALDADPQLDKLRFSLVPRTIDEATFWAAYFARVCALRRDDGAAPLPFSKGSRLVQEHAKKTATADEGKEATARARSDEGEEDHDADLDVVEEFHSDDYISVGLQDAALVSKLKTEMGLSPAEKHDLDVERSLDELLSGDDVPEDDGEHLDDDELDKALDASFAELGMTHE